LIIFNTKVVLDSKRIHYNNTHIPHRQNTVNEAKNKKIEG